jgi:flavoprotein
VYQVLKSLDLRINNTKIELLYTPVTETLMRVWKEKKGIVEIAAKQFNEFEKSSSKKSKPIKRKAAK